MALINQARAERLETELRPYLPLFTGAAEKLRQLLQGFSPAPVKCSVSRFRLETIDLEKTQPFGRPFRHSHGQLRLFLRADRAFDSLLCELCFGGSGVELHGEEENDRPPSKVELFLRNMAFEQLHASFPDVLNACFDTDFEIESVEPQPQKGVARTDLSCISVSILVNVFSLSAELDILMPVQEIEAAHGNQHKKLKTQSGTMIDVMGACPFEVVVSLPPQELSLDTILGLSVGSVLKLMATPTQPSLLHVGGVPIGQGRLRISPDSTAVMVT